MDFNSVKEYLFDAARQAGLDEYEVYFMESDGISAETLKDEISSFSSAVSGGICFRCIVDGKIGSAATELFTKEEMAELVERAKNNAKYIENDDRAIIYKGSSKYAEISPINMATSDAAEAYARRAAKADPEDQYTTRRRRRRKSAAEAVKDTPKE